MVWLLMLNHAYVTWRWQNNWMPPLSPAASAKIIHGIAQLINPRMWTCSIWTKRLHVSHKDSKIAVLFSQNYDLMTGPDWDYSSVSLGQQGSGLCFSKANSLHLIKILFIICFYWNHFGSLYIFYVRIIRNLCLTASLTNGNEKYVLFLLSQ